MITDTDCLKSFMVSPPELMAVIAPFIDWMRESGATISVHLNEDWVRANLAHCSKDGRDSYIHIDAESDGVRVSFGEHEDVTWFNFSDPQLFEHVTATVLRLRARI